MEMVVALGLLTILLPLMANLLPLGTVANRRAQVLQVAGALGGILVEESTSQRTPDLVGERRVIGAHDFRCWRTSTVNAAGLMDITVRVENPLIKPQTFVTRVKAPQ